MTDNSTNAQDNRGQGPGQPSGLPSASTFSFKAPFPISPAGVSALKHRRVSLASPSSPRLVPPHSFRDEMGLHTQAPTSGPEKKGKMRKIDTTQQSSEGSTPAPEKEKRPRKKWSQEETQMLVTGCQLHGVGNWKTILQDPNLRFHDRSAVDLKDRFRTYFPDAYKKHYPNARTHLSSKIRSTLSDGTSLFEKTRSKRRRPFTEAEDLALKAGYEKYGTTWATIVKDPIFQAQERRSTDLRDRFRNAYPDLYQAAGYKPRTSIKKKVDTPVRAADDSAMAGAGPVRNRKKAKASGLLRGGTKSVPQSTVVSEDEDSSAGEEEGNEISKVLGSGAFPFSMDADAANSTPEDDEEMRLISDNTDALQIPDFLPNNTHASMDTWSGLSTPTHSSVAAWSTGGGSPTSSHIDSTSSDFFMAANHSHGHGHGHSQSLSASATSSPFIHRRGAESVDGANHFIGKSAWSEQDWLSLNPRLDPRNVSSSDTGSNEQSSGIASPPSPWSFNQAHLHSGIHDRYDLFGYMPDGHGFSDELSAFSPGPGVFDGTAGANSSVGPSAGGTGFKGYHSQIAGDLISGASSNSGSRFAPANSISTALLTSFPSNSTLSMSMSSVSGMYNNSSFQGGNTGFGAGNGTASAAQLESAINGLGLEGIPQNTGIHPMQLHSHTPNMLGIDAIGMTGISLNERDHHDRQPAPEGAGRPTGQGSSKDAMETAEEQNAGMNLSTFGLHRSPVKHTPKSNLKEEPDLELGLEELVDMAEHATPPATPLITHPRPMRRASGNMLGNRGFDPTGANGSGSAQHHARSISVPPGEARNGGAHLGVAMSMDDVGLHMHHGHVNFAFFSPPSGVISSAGRGQHHGQQQHHHHQDPQTQTQQHAHYQDHRNPSPMHISMSTSSSSIHSPISPLQQHQSQHNNTSQLTPIFPTHLALSPSSSVGVSSPPSSGHFNSSPLPSLHQEDQLWRSAFNNTALGSAALMNGDPSYSLQFLDLHYYGHPTYSTGMSLTGHAHHHHHSHMANSLGLEVLDENMELSSSARQGQAALDLAQSAALASMGGVGLGNGLGLGLGLPLRSFNTPSPVGTIRHHPATNGSTKDKPSVVDMFGGGGPPVNQIPPQSHGLGMLQQTAQVHMMRGAGGRGDSDQGMGTIRQKNPSAGNGTMGRSMSHHRGQSVVCPQDLVLRSDNKRKRASWDGGVV